MNVTKSFGYIRYKALYDFFRETAEIPYAVVKGEVLSMALYGETGCRNSNDVDILTSKKHVLLLEKKLAQQGFEPLLEKWQNIREKRIFLMSNSHQTIQYRKSIDEYSVDVDINFRLYWGEANISEDMDSFLSDTETLEIFGCMVKSLPLEKQLLHLCIHNYKDINSIYILLRRRNPIHFRIFNEIRLLLNRVYSLNRLPQFVDSILELDAVAYVYYMLYYTNLIEKSDEIYNTLKLLEPYADKSILNCYGLNLNERKIWQCNFFERYEVEDLMPLIKPSLGEDDIKKVQANLKYYKNWRVENNGK